MKRHPNGQGLRVVSLFSGIGALDRGLELSGHVVVALCENWEPACRVLKEQFEDVPLHADVTDFSPEVEYEVLAAGFPCTDLSHAGRMEGIFGPKSGLVEHVFRIVEETKPQWVVLENVPHLLSLHAGAGIRHVIHELERLKYRWAYRTVDSRFTGVPQRRPRVIILAARDYDPAFPLLSDDAGEPYVTDAPDSPHGFYWTEGRNGIGLVQGATPTLKGGSTLGLPSAPAIWLPTAQLGHRFVLPTIEDAEALQGLPRGWTEAAVADGEADMRLKLVGNAVTVGVGEWIGNVINTAVYVQGPAGSEPLTPTDPIDRSGRWPEAAWGFTGQAWRSDASRWPEHADPVLLKDMLTIADARPLSHRATLGFLNRLDEKRRSLNSRFYEALEVHAVAMDPHGDGVPVDGPHAARRPMARMLAHLRAEGHAPLTHHRPLAEEPVRVDIALDEHQVAVVFRSCFWHGCPEHPDGKPGMAARWSSKIARTVARDQTNDATLAGHGWSVVAVWEHENHEGAVGRVDRVIGRNTSGGAERADGNPALKRRTTDQGERLGVPA